VSFERFRGAAAAGALALVACTQWSTTARADEHAFLFEDGAELLAQARELYVEGTKAIHQGQLEKARVLYLSAWRAQRHWQIAGSLGHVEAALDRYRDAAEHLTIFTRETRALPTADPRVDPRDAAVLAQELDRVKAHVGTIALSVEPAGAEVLVDGAPAGRAPLADPVFVEPGRHVIEAHLDGYRAVSESRDLTPGAVAQVSFQLAPAPPAAVVAAPGYTVTPAVALAPTAPPPVALRPPQRLRPVDRAVLIGGGALTAVALGMGVGFAVRSNAVARERDTYRAGCRAAGAAACGSYNDLAQTTWMTGNAAAYSFLGAGVLALATGAYAIAVPRWQRPIKVTGSLGPGGGDARIEVAW